MFTSEDHRLMIRDFLHCVLVGTQRELFGPGEIQPLTSLTEMSYKLMVCFSIEEDLTLRCGMIDIAHLLNKMISVYSKHLLTYASRNRFLGWHGPSL